jgi:hypothetical protein
MIRVSQFLERTMGNEVVRFLSCRETFLILLCCSGFISDPSNLDLLKSVTSDAGIERFDGDTKE